MSSSFIIPEKTQKLMTFFDKTNKWYPWSRTEVLLFPDGNYEYQKWMDTIKENAIYFEDLGNTTKNPYDLHSFEATIVTAAYPNLVIGMDNSTGKAPYEIAYTQSTGLESSTSLEVGVTFNLGVEFGTAFASIKSELGFHVTAGTNETVQKAQVSEMSTVIDPGDSTYLYQLSYQFARIKGYVMHYSDGAWVGVVRGVGNVSDFSPVFMSSHTPLG